MKNEILVGAIAGVAGVAAMHYLVTPLMYKLEDKTAYQREKELQPENLEAPHVLAARTLRALGREKNRNEVLVLGKINEFIFGIGPAILYSKFLKNSSLNKGRGFLFGLSVFIIADEILVPLLKLSGPNTKYPWQTHARGLVGHLMYGLATDASIRVLDNQQQGSIS